MLGVGILKGAETTKHRKRASEINSPALFYYPNYSNATQLQLLAATTQPLLQIVTWLQ